MGLRRSPPLTRDLHEQDGCRVPRSPSDSYILIRRAGETWGAEGISSCVLGHKIPGRNSDRDDGIFASWHWDGACLRVANDRYGFYPLYYFADADRCAVSPSIPTLLALGAGRELDYTALAVFFQLGYFLGDDTPFRAIRALPPDATFLWQRGELTVSGKLALGRAQGYTRNSAVEGYITLFREALLRRTPGDARSAVLLSGGRDSRHILLELLNIGVRPDLCLTVGRQVPHVGSDEEVSRHLAQVLDLEHVVIRGSDPSLQQEMEHNLRTNFCSDELAWLLPAAAYLEGKASIVYDGIGGDVLSAGLFLTPQLVQLCESQRYAELAEQIIGTRHVEPFLRESVRARVRRELAVARVAEELRRHSAAANPVTSFYFWNRTRREIALSPYRVFADLGTVFSPYLDHALYDLLAGLEANMLVEHDFHSEAIRRGFPKYAGIPYSVKPASFVHDKNHCRQFALEVATNSLTRKCSFLRKSFLLPRLFRSLFDPSYVSAVLWLGPFAIYLFQLDELVSQGKT